MVRAVGVREWINIEGQHWIAEVERMEGVALVTEVGARCSQDAHTTVSYVKNPTGAAEKQCRFRGVFRGCGTPVYLAEAAVARALELASARIVGIDLLGKGFGVSRCIRGAT